MSSLSTVTYMSIYIDYEPWRFQWVSDVEPEAPEKAPPSSDYMPGPEHPPSPDYVPVPEHPPSPNYVPGPEHPPSPDYVPGPEETEQASLSPDYVPEPEYPEYLVPSNAEVPIEDQPLPVDASPTALSPGYIADFDSEEDPEEDPANYPADRGENDDDESSDDHDDDDDEEEDKEEGEEHLDPADYFVLPIDEPVPSAKDTKAFETDESAPTPPSPRPRRARISVRLLPPMSASTEALIAEFAFAPTPPLPPPSPLTPLSAAGIRLRAASPSTYHPSEIASPPLLLPSTSHRDDIPKANMRLRKRACFTAPTGRFEVRESSAAAAARQPGLEDDMVRDMEERAPTLEDLSQRVTDLTTDLARDTHEMYVQFEDAQDDRALLRARVNTLFRDRRYHPHTSMLLESEARYAREAWEQAMDCNKPIHTKLQAYRAEIKALHEQIGVLQRQIQ
ncbi:hypothetical protein Tco_1077187 [Tanacetum coccineum]